MSVKTERITILSTPDFKQFLLGEARREGVSMSQLIRQRCLQSKAKNEEDEVLQVLVQELRTATARAKSALDQGLADADAALRELRKA